MVVLLNNEYWYYPESLNFYISDDSDETLSYDEYVERLFCSSDNLQILCKSCHRKKTLAETKKRKKK